MKCIIFTAESTYARFRRPYTTTSALTFSMIHPIAAKGLIGAMMGIEYENLFDYTKNMKIGIQVLNSVYKDMQSFNLIAQTRNNDAANFQSRVEFLRDVKYRIFLWDEETKLNQIKDVLQSRAFTFTPYLGCSEHIAKIRFEGIYTLEEAEEPYVDTAAPAESIDIENGEDFVLYTDRIPTKNNSSREYTEYAKVVFTVQGRLTSINTKLYKAGGYNVFFF